MRVPVRAVLLVAGFSMCALPSWSLAQTSVAQPPAAKPTLRRVWADSATELSGTLSPDGRLLTYVDWSTGDLWVRELASRTRRRVTSGGSMSEPVGYALAGIVSPDGQRVAYVWRTDSAQEIRVAALTGGEPRTLMPADWVHGWTGDGRELLVSRWLPTGRRDIGLVPAAGGAYRPIPASPDLLASASRFELSPSGRHVLLTRTAPDDPAQRDVDLLYVADGGRRRLVARPTDDHDAVWTPEGDGVVFVGQRNDEVGLWHIDVRDGRATGTPRLVASLPAPMMIVGVSPDGTVYLGQEGSQQQVFVARVDWGDGTGEAVVSDLTRIPVQPGFLDARRAVFSPDGRRLAYVTKDAFESVRPGWATPVVRTLSGPDSGAVRAYPTRLTLRDEPVWSPSGDALYFMGPAEGSRGESADQTFTAWRLDLASGAWSRAGSVGAAGLVRPAGIREQELVIRRVTYQPPTSTASALDLRIGSSRDLFRSSGPLVLDATLSMDGRRLVLAISDTDRGFRLHVIPAGPELVTGDALGPPLAVLGGSGARAQVAWVDGDRALLVTGRVDGRQGIWRIPVDGRRPQRLALAGQRLLEVRPSPDGRRVAFTSATDDPNSVWAVPLGGTYRLIDVPVSNVMRRCATSVKQCSSPSIFPTTYRPIPCSLP